MYYIIVYQHSPDNRERVTARFKELDGQPPAGLKLLGRWFDLGRRRVLTVVQTDDPLALGTAAMRWSDLATVETFPVLDDEQLTRLLAETA